MSALTVRRPAVSRRPRCLTAATSRHPDQPATTAHHPRRPTRRRLHRIRCAPPATWTAPRAAGGSVAPHMTGAASTNTVLTAAAPTWVTDREPVVLVFPLPDPQVLRGGRSPFGNRAVGYRGLRRPHRCQPARTAPPRGTRTPVACNLCTSHPPKLHAVRREAPAEAGCDSDKSRGCRTRIVPGSLFVPGVRIAFPSCITRASTHHATPRHHAGTQP